MLDVFKETGRTVCASVDQKVGKVARERDIVGRGYGHVERRSTQTQ